ncbi:4-(cytidine 5'-diphospho)-2-C-methyl-D-erythritol kinase [Streptomyces sp. N2-109]|uniref:4-diphosphocytidyl-2-C-methyl-D-erythritol kinase n=1 Tax=Streptomyces gossypii TaxID=2883101 RepID=A0ABT2JYS5_9ACTN|nr:4-(cytidine 5'-diphospho)-2-C-methyl-D-erythritol kinase [Streptomyces gossypii]MCT2593048.1 4-(cytidine 5'-diphospho)-2-C-methyl-D-erythritol kinase [Streptomyces gossypii]
MTTDRTSAGATNGAGAGAGAGEDSRTVTVRVPAKVNVQLAVGGIRPDGFHGLANVFLAVSLYDEVSATPAATPRLTVSGADAGQVPLDDSNLAVRAARALATHHGLGESDPVHLHLSKDIPVAGGMAGGSADAAGALLACDALWNTRTSHDELLALCAELGSDVPFSLLGGAALGRGRGELLTPLEVGGTFHWVFAVADGGLSTPAVYGECDRLREASGGGATVADVGEPEPAPALLDALRTGDATALAAALAPHGGGSSSNDLQSAALSLRPSLAATLHAGTAAGALAALVSGSGPTCAFLTKDADSAETVAAALLASGTCRTARRATGPAPGATVVG